MKYWNFVCVFLKQGTFSTEITESQGHRITEQPGCKEPLEITQSNPQPRQDHLEQ